MVAKESKDNTGSTVLRWKAAMNKGLKFARRAKPQRIKTTTTITKKQRGRRGGRIGLTCQQ